MELKFEINHDLLVACALFSKRGNTLEGWTDTKNQLWDKYREAYELFIYKKIETYFADNNYQHKLRKASEQISRLMSACQKTEDFKKLLKETEDYKMWLEKEWDEKGINAINELENILKINLPQNTLTVQVVTPVFSKGFYFGNNQIIWGHTEDWPNYSVVYLLHESLHAVLGTGETEHLAIQLATDNELRKRLNNSDYLVDGNLVGHDYHLDQLKKLMPSWSTYIKDPKKTIHQFISEQKKG